MANPRANASAEASWHHVDDGTHDQTLEENWLFQLRKERYRSRLSAKTHDFYVIHLVDAVHVIAITPERQVILVRQFRAGSACDSLETPGGILESGEDPCTAGARELLEETGYAGDSPRLLGTFWANPSIITSRFSTIVIDNARRVAAPDPDANEELLVELVDEREIPRYIQEGQIDHGLVVAGLFWWMMERNGALGVSTRP